MGLAVAIAIAIRNYVPAFCNFALLPSGIVVVKIIGGSIIGVGVVIVLGIVLLRVGGDGDGTEERHDERSHPNPHARVLDRENQ